MTRPNGVIRGTLPPDQWSSWVLSFGKGNFPDDPVRQAVRRTEFHQWRRDSDAWFAERGIPESARVCNEEHRRRAAAWQELHPEDRGPTLGRAKD
jgi:hypothetical protein